MQRKFQRLQLAREQLQKQINEGAVESSSAVLRFIDPISGSLMIDPFTAADGKNYEHRNIELWFQNSSISPVTRQPISTDIVPNVQLKQEIQKVC